jgi:hypothetical protein
MSIDYDSIEHLANELDHTSSEILRRLTNGDRAAVAGHAQLFGKAASELHAIVDAHNTDLALQQTVEIEHQAVVESYENEGGTVVNTLSVRKEGTQHAEPKRTPAQRKRPS